MLTASLSPKCDFKSSLLERKRRMYVLQHHELGNILVQSAKSRWRWFQMLCKYIRHD